MTQAIIGLLKDLLISGAGTVESFLKDLYWYVFFIEEQLTNLQTGTAVMDFNAIYKTIYSWSLILLIIMFLKKMIQTYFLWKTGEEDQSPIRVLIGLFEAIAIMITFGWIYSYVIGIGYSFYSDILRAGSFDSFSIDNLIAACGNGLFAAIIAVILFVIVLSMIWQFIRRGLELLIMRCIVPLTAIGLLNSNGGAFAVIVKKFSQNIFTVIVQLVLLYLTMKLIEAQHFIYAIASGMLCTSTPAFLNEFLVQVGGTGLTGMVGKGVSFMHHLGGAMMTTRNLISSPIIGGYNNVQIAKNAMQEKGGGFKTGAKAFFGATGKELLGGYRSTTLRDRSESRLRQANNLNQSPPTNIKPPMNMNKK